MHEAAQVEMINFELARLERWKFGAKTEAMEIHRPLVTAQTQRYFPSGDLLKRGTWARLKKLTA